MRDRLEPGFEKAFQEGGVPRGPARRRVLHPALPIKPGIVKVKTNLKTDVGRTTLANSITMTPGTITVDIIDDIIYVHWIYVSSTDPEIYTEKISGRFEKYIRRIFE